MTKNQILRRAIKNSGLTQKELAERSGFKAQNNISVILKNKDSGIENVRKILEAAGYWIEVTNGKDRWVLDGVEEKDREQDRKDLMKKLKGLSGREFSAIEETLAQLLGEEK